MRRVEEKPHLMKVGGRPSLEQTNVHGPLHHSHAGRKDRGWRCSNALEHDMSPQARTHTQHDNTHVRFSWTHGSRGELAYRKYQHLNLPHDTRKINKENLKSGIFKSERNGPAVEIREFKIGKAIKLRGFTHVRRNQKKHRYSSRLHRHFLGCWHSIPSHCQNISCGDWRLYLVLRTQFSQ